MPRGGQMDIGFIGLGNMGFFMARNLQKAGHDLVVSDIRPDLAQGLVDYGAKFVTTPREVAERAQFMCTSLPGPKQVEQVSLGSGGLIEGLSVGKIYVDLSTSTPDLIRRIGSEFKSKGTEVLDAPVSGGATGAEAGTLAVYVGGEREVYDRVSLILSAIGDKVQHCGPLGAGEVTKLCNNLIAVGLIVFMPEVFTAGVKAGVSGQTLFDAISGGSGQTEMMKHSLPNILKREFGGSVGAGVILKDLELGLQLGESNGVPMEVTRAMVQKLREASENGFGDQPVLWQEKQAGTEIRP